MAPSSATDIGRTAADTIFMGESLLPALVARDVAIVTQRLSIQNFTLAVGYNFLAVPIAMLGFASPLIAAVAMSTSSIIVIANSLRLGLSFTKQKTAVVTKRQPDSAGISHFERRAA
jgi:Cu2+-exporting ATPase